jgi:hypothetical protein
MVDRIRPYGPGKFHTVLDSYAYETALDGIDDEESYPDGDGWYGLLWLDPDTRDRIREIAGNSKNSLNAAEESELDGNAAIIFFERSDGIVEAEWFETRAEAHRAWADIVSEFEEMGAEEEEEEEEEP